MKVNIYKKLCNYCDKILISNKNSLSTLSYSKLHVIKNHPDFIKEYLLSDHSERNTKVELKIKSFLSSIVNYLKLLSFEQPNFYFKKKKLKKIDVLLISHLISIKHLNLIDDFYFGLMKNKLKKIGLTSKIILRNETKYLSKHLFSNLKKDKVILSKRTFLIKELIFIIYAFFQFLKFNLFIDKFKIKKKKINFFNLRSFGYIITNLRLNFQINRLLKTFNPKYVVITFEGHAWEKLVIKDIKKKGIKVFAYQFSTITKHHHSLFRKLDNESSPDCIFTTSKQTKDIFKKEYGCPVKIIGSSKSKKNKYRRLKKNKSVLILPEAYLDESKLMLKFAIETLIYNKNIKFYLRLHPMIDISELNINLKNYPNIKLSNCKIIDDFKRCTFVLHRGSSAAVQAVAYGLNPIYYGKFDEFNVNPLYQEFDKDYYVDDVIKFIKILNNKTYTRQSRIISYANNYFKKMNIHKKTFDIK